MAQQSVRDVAQAAPLKVEKRDGRIVAWNPDNIVSAVTKAYKDVQGVVDGQDVANIHDLADRVEAEARGRYTGPVRISDLQTMVEQRLIATHHYEVAKAYTEYRFKRDVARAKTTDVNEAVRRFVDKDPALVHENANKDSNVYSTQRDLLAGAVSKAVAFSMLPPDVANAHMKGDIHFHDADYSPFTAQTNCFSPSTRFLTVDGVYAFRDFRDGDIIKVPTPDGSIHRAVVADHGVKSVQEILFEDIGVKNPVDVHNPYLTPYDHMVVATPDHRWPLKDGSITECLAVGDELAEYNGHRWRVASISALDKPIDVWCLDVEDVHEFLLDGGIPTKNCSLPNFWDMLANGFTLGNAPMASPKSIAIAATQITQIMKDVASSQYGGQTANRADEHLAVYAKKDYDKFLAEARETMPDDLPLRFAERQVHDAWAAQRGKLHFEPDRKSIPMDEPFHPDADPIGRQREILAKIRTRKAIYDAMQTMEYQINSNRVSNGQTPFVTVGFGLGTDWFAREITRAIFLNRIRGLGRDHRTAIFPKLVYGIRHGVNADKDDPNYDLKQLALECATKRMYPDVVFYENLVDITGNYKAPMGCRSFLQKWVDPATGEEVNDGRMNLGVVSVNIPRIALESRHADGTPDIDRFWSLFDERMEVARHALRFRIKRCREASPKNAPTLFEYGAFGRLGPDGDVDDLFRNGRATVSLGYIGLAETVGVFYGKDWIRDHDYDPKGRDFALSIVKRMAKLCERWEAEEGYHYSVYSTPAESLTDRFNRMDREKFGRVEGVTDHDFYTNSFHYPVWLHPTPMEKLAYEEPFPHYASGGFINYCEYPRMQDNPKALEAVWDYAHSIGIGYLGTNAPIDHCFVCGYEGDFTPTGEGFKCPECGNADPSRCDVTKRTCGYLGNPVQRPMVHGRHEEIAHRVKHMSGETGRVREANGDEKDWFVDAASQSHANR